MFTYLKNLFFKERQLKDYDTMTLSELGFVSEEQFKYATTIETPVCPKCQGELYKIIPEVFLKELTLCECRDCKERCYKKLPLDENKEV